MKNIIYLLIGISFLFSCNKERDPQTITGIIMKDCNSTPMANEDFVLYNQGNRSFTGGRFEVPFTTDASGNFCVTYTDGFWSTETVIKYEGEEFFTPLDNGNTGVIILRPTINIEPHIKINNNYSQGDTLRIFSNYGNVIKIPFPFNDTVLDTISNVRGINSEYLKINGMESKLKVNLKLIYRVDSGQFRTSSFKVKKQEEINERFDGCLGDKVYQVNLEIN